MHFQFQDFSELMHMGGHGPYVWFSYTITFICLIYLLIAPLRRRRALQRDLARQQRITGRANPASSPSNGGS